MANGPFPAIPAPAHAPSLTASNGLVSARWDNVGTDVWYSVWICDKTKSDCSVEGTSSPWVPAWPYQALTTAGSYLYVSPFGAGTAHARPIT
jgi:hypothetical protein